MTRDLVLPFARLRAELEQLSNAQMARYLTKLVLEELRNGESTTETDKGRAVEGRRRRNHPVHRAPRAAAAGRVAEVAGPFVFGEEISIPREYQA